MKPGAILIAALSCLLVIGSGWPVPAAEAGPGQSAPGIDLRDAIRLALDHNHRVKVASFQADAAASARTMAASRYYPQLSFEEQFSAANSPTRTFMMKLDQGRFTQNDFQINNLNHPGTWRNFKTALTVVQSLFDPAALPATEMAALEADKALAGHEAARQELAFQVFMLYLDGTRAVGRIGALKRALAEADENLRLARARQREGAGLASDTLRAETHRATVEHQLISARNDRTLAAMRLALAMGEPAGNQVTIRETAIHLEPVCGEAELVARALRERQDLRQARTDLARGEATVSMARRAYLPALDAFGAYERNGREYPFDADNDAWMAGVSLKWNVFDGFRREAEQSRARAARSAAAAELAAREAEARLQISETCLRREEAAQQRNVARTAQLAAGETVRLLTRRYENSLATMLDLLDAQAALNQARSRVVDAEAEYAFAAGRIYFATGTFLKEILR